MTILGEGALLFVMCLIGSVVPWMGKPISLKRYIAICGVGVIVWVLVALLFAVKG